MGNRTLNNKIKHALSGGSIEVSQAQMSEIIRLSKVQFEKRRVKKRMGFGELLLSQIRFAGLRIWGGEIITAILLGLILQGFLMEPYFLTARKAALFLSCAMIGASLLLLPFIYRSSRFQMTEIEGAAYFSIRRILICRFLLFFGGEVVIAAAVGIIGYAVQFENGSMLIYVLLPLLITGDGILFCLKNVPLEKICFHYLGYAGVLLLLLIICYYAAPWMFDGGFLALPLGAGAGLMGYFIQQCNSLVKRPEETLFV